MTFRSFVRQVDAAKRRSQRQAQVAANRRERDAQRYYRELLKAQKENARAEAEEQARNEYELHRSELDVLLSMHKECADTWDWKTVLARPAPVEPRFSDASERLAAEALAKYVPGFFARLFGRAEGRRTVLEQEVHLARAADKRLHEEALAHHERERSSWAWHHELAQGILAGDISAYESALEHLDPFEELDQRGVSLEVGTGAPWYVEATAVVSDKDVVPTQEKKLLASGKLSVKDMAAGKRMEIYQDYVCSCALRIGRELLALLPVQLAVVHVETDILNPASGRQEQTVVLSVAFSPSGMQKLNFDTLDPSCAMTNFVHEMGFKKSSGFAAVRRLDANFLRSGAGERNGATVARSH